MCHRCNFIYKTYSKFSKICLNCKKEPGNDKMEEALKINGIYGFKKCPQWLKKRYCAATNSCCQLCQKKYSNSKFNNFSGLEIHRIKRGNQGGLYTVVPLDHRKNNVMVLCKSCHQTIHYKEYRSNGSV